MADMKFSSAFTTEEYLENHKELTPGRIYVTTKGNMYLDTIETRMLIESSSKNYDLPINVIRYSSPAGTRSKKILKNTNFQLQDKYVVGENKLQLFVDDMHLSLGSEYNEVGVQGEESNIIQFVDWDIDIDSNIEYIIIGKDYLTVSINGNKVAKVNNNIDLPIPTKTSDIINNSGFITDSDIVKNAEEANSTKGTLTIKQNGNIVKSYNGSENIEANIKVPQKTTDLTDSNLVIYSKDESIKDMRIISSAAYDALDKSTIPNNTVYLVY